jgi:hypothetical protein
MVESSPICKSAQAQGSEERKDGERMHAILWIVLENDRVVERVFTLKERDEIVLARRRKGQWPCDVIDES